MNVYTKVFTYVMLSLLLIFLDCVWWVVHHHVQHGLHSSASPWNEPLWPGVHWNTEYLLGLCDIIFSKFIVWPSRMFCLCRMWMTPGASSIHSSTVQVSWTCTLIKKLLYAAWSTAATAPSFCSSSPGLPCTTRSEMTAKTSLTISPSPYWHRPVC